MLEILSFLAGFALALYFHPQVAHAWAWIKQKFLGVQ